MPKRDVAKLLLRTEAYSKRFGGELRGQYAESFLYRHPMSGMFVFGGKASFEGMHMGDS